MGVVQYYAAGPHPVQAVYSCSWPECMVLRCQKSLTDQAIDDFLANAPNKTKLSLGIKKNFAVVAAMVKAHPCLKVDFQVLNIDLDRCDDPISKEDPIRLAKIPGLCVRVRARVSSSQLTLNKALEQLTGVSSLPVAPPQRTEPAKVARPSRKATINSSSLRGGQTEDARLKKGGAPAPRARVGASSTVPRTNGILASPVPPRGSRQD